MKILLVTQLYPLTDHSRNSFALHYFVKEWQKKNEVCVLRTYLNYEKEVVPLEKRIVLDGVEVNVFQPIWIPVLKKTVFNARVIFDQLNFKPDVILAHLYNSYLSFEPLARKLDIPFVVGIHNSDLKLLRNPFQMKRALKVIQRADGVVFRSHALLTQYINQFGKLKSPVFIANSGLPSNYIDFAKKLINTNEGISIPSAIELVSACSLIPLKHIHLVLEALSELNTQGCTNWNYTIIGDGSEEYKLKAMSKKMGLERQVSFRGRLSREAVFESLKSSHIFVMPSYPETFGLAYLEAMSAGCIVVGTAGWGIDGVIHHGENGYLCAPGNSVELKDVLKGLLEAPKDHLNKVRSNSLSTVLNYTNEKVGDDYLSFLDEIIQGKLMK